MLRQGDSGQFERCATVALGRGAAEAQLLEPPARFVGMPLEEEEWVRAARMEAKKARYGPRGGGRRGGRRRSPRRSPEEREAVAALAMFAFPLAICVGNCNRNANE